LANLCNIKCSARLGAALPPQPQLRGGTSRPHDQGELLEADFKTNTAIAGK
jgi:hypothetical protein